MNKEIIRIQKSTFLEITININKQSTFKLEIALVKSFLIYV